MGMCNSFEFSEMFLLHMHQPLLSILNEDEVLGGYALDVPACIEHSFCMWQRPHPYTHVPAKKKEYYEYSHV